MAVPALTAIAEGVVSLLHHHKMWRWRLAGRPDPSESDVLDGCGAAGRNLRSGLTAERGAHTPAVALSAPSWLRQGFWRR